MAIRSLGVLVVGDEVLCGKRRDRHFDHVVRTLAARGLKAAWCRYVGDDREAIIEALEQTQLGERPVVCFGGIGATPDDQTRAAAAAAFGRPLRRHPEAAGLIEAQFGAPVHPDRIRLADLPEDCLLIPNPCNQIPGFTLYDHHFLPGFPRMAWPMLDWVLNTYYPEQSAASVERSLRIQGVAESELIGLMERLARAHHRAKLFSLPRLGDRNSIELGFRGEPAAVDAAFSQLRHELARRSLRFEDEPIA